MNIENWNFEEYQKEKKEYLKKKELDEKSDTYLVEYLHSGKEYIMTFKSAKPEYQVNKYIHNYLKEKYGISIEDTIIKIVKSRKVVQ